MTHACIKSEEKEKEAAAAAAEHNECDREQAASNRAADAAVKEQPPPPPSNGERMRKAAHDGRAGDGDGDTNGDAAAEDGLEAEGGAKNLDSGYAWLILAVMFLLASSTGGTNRVYGLIYAKQVATGYYDHEQASWPIATGSTVENLAGLLTPALAQWLSWRQLELLATGLFVCANVGAYFSDSLAIDILCLGIIQGLALSINTVLSLVINNDYFRRYRTTAYGISLSGSTFGILYLGPLVSWCLEREPGEFRSGYLAIGAVLALNAVLVIFIRPRERGSDGQRGDDSLRHKSGSSQKAPAAAGAAAARPARRAERKVSLLERHLERKNSVASIALRCKQTRQSELQQSGAGQSGGAVATAASGIRRKSTRRCGPLERPQLSLKKTASSSTDSRRHQIKLAKQDSCGLFTMAAAAAATEATSKPQAAEKKASVASFMSSRFEPQNGSLDRFSLAESQHQLEGLDGKHEHQLEDAGFSGRLVVALLKSPYLHCVWIMLSLYYLIARIFIIILVDLAKDNGLSSGESRALLNYWSLGEIVGRIVLCSFVDLQWLSVRNCILLTCSAMSACIGAMALIGGSFYLYAGCSALVAALISLEYVLINVLMIEYLGESRVTSCYSLGSLISSLVLLGRPALIGLFRDQLGSYNGLLLLLAGLSLAYGLLFGLLEPLLVRYWPKRRLLPAGQQPPPPTTTTTTTTTMANNSLWLDDGQDSSSSIGSYQADYEAAKNAPASPA